MTNRDDLAKEVINSCMSKSGFTGQDMMSAYMVADFILAREAKLAYEIQEVVQDECRGGINVAMQAEIDGLTARLSSAEARIKALEGDLETAHEDKDGLLCMIKKAIVSLEEVVTRQKSFGTWLPKESHSDNQIDKAFNILEVK